jgi:HAD superfamily phosphoserine phosphatase-like hydrolase
MSDVKYKFVFDLDGTLTAEETLPMIGRQFGRQAEIKQITAEVIRGTVPFVTGFLERVRLLGDLDVGKVSDLLAKTRLNLHLKDFVLENQEICAIATGNFRGWIDRLSSKFGCQVFASEGSIGETGHLEISSVLQKEEVVKYFQGEGYRVVFIGEGNNDSEAMRCADLSIAFGLVHEPANSVLQVADYLVYSEVALVRLLQQIKSPVIKESLVLSAAGIGSRLGIGQTKGLLDFFGKSLISHQLSLFEDIVDLRVVVGFQASDLVLEVLKHRTDVVFVYNREFATTGTGMSVYLGSLHGGEHIIAWDGDTIIHPEDVKKCLTSDSEFLGVSYQKTEDGVFANLDKNGDVTGFNRSQGDLEWTGPARLHHSKIVESTGNLYEMITGFLPMPSILLRALDVDTQSDYSAGLQLFKSWYLGNQRSHQYYKSLAESISSPQETRNRAPDSTEWDVALVKRYSSVSHDLLDLGSGTGLMINEIAASFRSVMAVEKYKEFSRFIKPRPNLDIINEDVLNLDIHRKFHLVTLFGLMNFFSDLEAKMIYKKAFESLQAGGQMIVKHQMGIESDVTVTGISEELGVEYFSNYRSLSREKEILLEVGFHVEDEIDIYPPPLNRWPNTHFYALVAQRL